MPGEAIKTRDQSRRGYNVAGSDSLLSSFLSINQTAVLITTLATESVSHLLMSYRLTNSAKQGQVNINPSAVKITSEQVK